MHHSTLCMYLCTIPQPQRHVYFCFEKACQISPIALALLYTQCLFVLNNCNLASAVFSFLRKKLKVTVIVTFQFNNFRGFGP